MHIIQPDPIEVCWLVSLGTGYHLQTLEEYGDLVKIHIVSIDSLRHSDSFATALLETISSNKVTAVVVSWCLSTASIIGALRTDKRVAQLPFIAVHDGQNEEIQVLARQLWADDVLKAPVSPELLSASILSCRRQTSILPSNGQIVQGMFTLDLQQQTLFYLDTEVVTTPTEYRFLRQLLKNPETLLTRELISLEVWGENCERSPNAIDVLIHRVKKKLAVFGVANCIQNVRGKGIKFVPPMIE